MESKFKSGRLVLIELKEVESRGVPLIVHAYIVHLPAFKTNKVVSRFLRNLAREALRDVLGGEPRGRKRAIIDVDPDADAATDPSPEASPNHGGKRPRSAPQAAVRSGEEEVEVIMQEGDAMDLEPTAGGAPQAATAPSFAEESLAIINGGFSARACEPVRDLECVLFERVQPIMAIIATLMLRAQFDEILNNAAQGVRELERKAVNDLKLAEEAAARVAPHERLPIYMQLVADQTHQRSQIDEAARIAQVYNATRESISRQVDIFFEQTTPASPDEQKLTLAAMHYMVRHKGQRVQALLSAGLPACDAPGCTRLVHVHFGEPCCQRFCFAHRAPDHIGHVAFHRAVAAAAPAPIPAPLAPTLREAVPSPFPFEHDEALAFDDWLRDDAFNPAPVFDDAPPLL
jgi:hypothetical protein